MLFIIVSIISSSILSYTFKEKGVIPYSFLLIVLGIIFTFTENTFGGNDVWSESIHRWQHIHPETILFVFIPPLIYNSSAHINFHVLRKYTVQIFILVVPIVLISSFSTGYFIKFITELSFINSLILGVIISATDPVAVSRILEDLHISEKLRILIEGESLFNDGSVYVIFGLLMEYGHQSTTSIIAKSFYIPVCSVLIGAIFGFVLFIILRKVYDDPVVEISLTIGICYITFYITDHVLGLSGILAVVILGLFYAGGGKTAISPCTQNSMETVWVTIDFIANNLIFIVSGLIISNGVGKFPLNKWMNIPLIYLFINVIRFIGIFLFYRVLKCDVYKIRGHQLVILGLSGIRGSITLTLALITGNQDILFYSSGIVFLTIPLNTLLVQGYIKGIMKHKYLHKVEQILHIREKLYSIGKTSIDSIQAGFYLKNVSWKSVENCIIKQELDPDNTIIEMDTVLEKRLIYLKTFKQTLWSLFSRNMIYRNIIIKLLEKIDQAIDSNDKILNITNMESIKLDVADSCFCFNKILKKKWLYHKINHKYNYFSAYILGQKYTLDNLKDILDENTIIQMESESKPSIDFSISFLRLIEKDYPNITQKIETRQTIHYILKNQQIYLKKLFKDGEINYYIYNQINKEINQKLNFD